MRGVLHQWAAVVTLGAGTVLVAMAPSARPAIAAAVFASSLLCLFSVSATFHRGSWSTVAGNRMRRLDHASIFVLIAGTYTPVAMLGLPHESGTHLLITIWTLAVLGIAKSLFWVHAPKVLTAGLAVAMGWTLVPWLGDVYRSMNPVSGVLVMLGGLAYTAGALAYATERPAMRPATFGYHEVFHALTLVGAGLHFVGVLILVRES